MKIIKLLPAIGLMALMVWPVLAADDCANLSVEQKVNCYEQKLLLNQGQQKTLNATISYLNNKMALTMAQINQTEAQLKTLEEEITALNVKIIRLDENLTQVAQLLVSRVGAAYKHSKFNPLFSLFSGGGLTNFLQKTKYLQAAQDNDRNILAQLQTAKDLDQQQKALKETKQAEAETLKQKLASQNASLNSQKISKQQLLEITQNDEKTYQSLLTAARQEMSAILSIIAGGGQETAAGEVSQGGRIATIISGRSACSTGTHLHFELGENGKNVNPANYLKPVDVTWDLCGWWPDCDSPFAFTGS